MTADRRLGAEDALGGASLTGSAASGTHRLIRPATGARSSERATFWARTLRGWDIAFYLMTGIAAAALALSGLPGGDLTLTLGLLAGLAAVYTAVGRRAAHSGSRVLAASYLVALVVATVAIVRVHPTGTVLLFIAYSQIWFFAETRRAGILWCGVLTLGIFGATALYEGLDSTDLPALATQSTLAMAFSVLLGLWVTQVAEQSEERAELLIRLEEAQGEIGRSHHDAGVAAERERMAQEIHDTLAQGFTSIIMLAQTAEADLRRDNPHGAADRVALIERTARDNLAEARALVAAFAPVGLDGSTLGEALGRLALRFEHETGVRVEVVLPGDHELRSIGREREVILLRAAQEALANVRRHAQARHVQLVLSLVPEAQAGHGVLGRGDGERPDDAPAGRVQLEVVDDGRGIDESAAEGFGLRGMRDRVTSGGGELEVSSGDTGGTRVRVALPVVDQDQPVQRRTTQEDRT